MGAIIARLIPLLAGLGLGEVLDKVLPDQFKSYVPAERPKSMEGIIKFVAFFALAAVVWGFIAKKLRLPVKFR
jgi:hypothetical protein